MFDLLSFIGRSLQLQDYLFSKNYIKNTWLPLQNCKSAPHWFTYLRHEEKVMSKQTGIYNHVKIQEQKLKKNRNKHLLWLLMNVCNKKFSQLSEDERD